MKRWLFAAAVVVAVVAVVAIVPSAASANGAWGVHQHGYSATGNWVLLDQYNTFIQASGFDAATQYPRGTPSAARTVNLYVEQNFCDYTNGQLVFRAWNGNATTDFTVAGNLSTASWTPVSVPLSGFEQLVPMKDPSGTCDDENLDWDNSIFQELTDAAVIGASFASTEPLEHSARPPVRHYSLEPGKAVQIIAQRLRYASVDATMTSTNPTLSIGALGPAALAAITGGQMIIEKTNGTCPAEGTWPHCTPP